MSQRNAAATKVRRSQDREVEERYYTPGEFAKLCKVSRSNVYMKIDMGEVLGVWVLGRLRVPKDWADEYLDELNRKSREALAAHGVPQKGSRNGW